MNDPTLTPNKNYQPPAFDDLNYTVMPQLNRPIETARPSAQTPSTKSAVPFSKPGVQLPPQLDAEVDDSSFLRQRNLVIIAAGVLVLIILVTGAYFLFRKKSNPQPQISQTKLPKVWLKQYFGKEICDTPNVCADAADSDADGLANYDEFKAGTSPVDSDTDKDSFADGDEANVYKTDPTLKYTDRRDLVVLNNWTDSFQILHGYDPLTPGIKLTETRQAQIAQDTAKFGLHEPTVTTLNQGPKPANPNALTNNGSNINTNANQNNGANNQNPQAKTWQVAIQNNQFSPQSITIKSSDIIIWTNKDSSLHHVASDPHPLHYDLPGLESTDLSANQTYSFTFTKTGTFGYHDHLNPNIHGTIVVQ